MRKVHELREKLWLFEAKTGFGCKAAQGLELEAVNVFKVRDRVERVTRPAIRLPFAEFDATLDVFDEGHADLHDPAGVEARCNSFCHFARRRQVHAQ